MNVSGQFLTFSLSVPLVQLAGQQRASGYISFVPVDTGGGLQLNVTDVTITGNTSLNNGPHGLRVGAVHAQLEVSAAILYVYMFYINSTTGSSFGSIHIF